MQLKVNNCGECPFKKLYSTKFFWCSHPQSKDNPKFNGDDKVDVLCPEGGAFEIKTSPITIKLNEDESK